MGLSTTSSKGRASTTTSSAAAMLLLKQRKLAHVQHACAAALPRPLLLYCCRHSQTSAALKTATHLPRRSSTTISAPTKLLATQRKLAHVQHVCAAAPAAPLQARAPLALALALDVVDRGPGAAVAQAGGARLPHALLHVDGRLGLQHNECSKRYTNMSAGCIVCCTRLCRC